jgi:hypothetical protein
VAPDYETKMKHFCKTGGKPGTTHRMVPRHSSKMTIRIVTFSIMSDCSNQPTSIQYKVSFMLSVMYLMLHVVKLNGIMLSVVMLSVVAAS